MGIISFFVCLSQKIDLHLQFFNNTGSKHDLPGFLIKLIDAEKSMFLWVTAPMGKNQKVRKVILRCVDYDVVTKSSEKSRYKGVF